MVNIFKQLYYRIFGKYVKDEVELEEAILNGYKYIKLKGEFRFVKDFTIPNNVTIYLDKDCELFFLEDN